MSAPDLLARGVVENLWPARTQMALSLGWHIVFACFGIAFPLIVVFTEWWGHRRRDAALTELAHTWAKAMGVLFAAGAVSGTLLSFEMGILWPVLMDRFGEVFGFPFVLEGFAFFVEAIFVGVYLFGWNRLSPRAHMLSAVPMVLAGIAGAFFVVSANAWMNNPTGFRLDANGHVVDPRPVAGMFGPSTWPQFTHMWLAAFMVTGFLVASVYAVGMLRGRRDRYHRMGLLIPLTVAAITAPVQIGVGDWIAKTVATNQPAKLAAMEAQYETTAGAGLSLGGIYRDDELRYALEIPYGLSLLIHHDPDAVVPGLEEVPPDQRPPVNVVHLAYNVMVGIGVALLLLGAWFGLVWWRRRRLPTTVWFLRAVAVSGVAAVVAMEAGWTTTEVGRQPWIVYGVLRTSDAVSPAPGLGYGLLAVIAVYTVLTVFTAVVLRRLARGHDTRAPQEVERRADR
ncbi:cytochrome bd-I ubiquinol oxidase subunit 1 apoprotein [Streptoalloteichus tenebrarius]|uniref:Cytochrome bd-I ubiquinol oxidase subunit 1 apoprotein n=1 Tax=Streptoalloteichus tenebrarius (strain ATCC 17920 / DSM 40477 / JCM 4838 / CBS 697.72 / NBRC 16177 / NCIMB 11028 / NRRL B-12390 / A12253. 1 / ISP 5477) TaxID=1933 RepID=A0ABT1HWG1_STRSD|nr:cytochrome ubiquinol oxidase subunit I [Streptoalloteichus tenebrarius]MCP2259857.1 cytochrome bd-I ubiquinol oxidase subunit 1 apoprotein [Streptoalloteichus tenebrarius]